MTNITEQYLCPKCNKAFPKANKKLHDLRCKVNPSNHQDLGGTNNGGNGNPLHSFGVQNGNQYTNNSQASQNSNDNLIYEEGPAFGYPSNFDNNQQSNPSFPQNSRNVSPGLDNQMLEEA